MKKNHLWSYRPNEEHEQARALFQEGKSEFIKNSIDFRLQNSSTGLKEQIVYHTKFLGQLNEKLKKSEEIENRILEMKQRIVFKDLTSNEKFVYDEIDLFFRKKRTMALKIYLEWAHDHIRRVTKKKLHWMKSIDSDRLREMIEHPEDGRIWKYFYGGGSHG